MFELILKWILLSLCILFVGLLIPGITIANFKTAMIAGLLIAFTNLFIKPILLFLTLPINILTLGFFVLVINALLFMFVASLINGIEINGFLNAFWGALLLSILTIGLEQI
mgnify:FL=1